jgi:hypothetical protein
MLDMTLFGESVQVGVADEVAPLETFVCEPCGYTEWFVIQPPAAPDPKHGITAVADNCPACGAGEHHLLARVHEHSEMGVVTWWSSPFGGEFSLLICARCGQVRWFVSRPVHGSELDERCPRCQGTRRDAEVYEHANFGTVRYPVACIGGEQIGLFRIHACTPCGLADWYATGPFREVADGNCRLERVRTTAAPRGPGHSDGGPYR